MIKFFKRTYDFAVSIIGKDMLLYIVFGILTTLINIVTYYLLALVGIATAISTSASYVVSIIFAYVTNRIWVFESKSTGKNEIISEVIKFLSVRGATWLADLILMIILVDYLKLNNLMCKIAVNVIVIIINYIAGKLVVFKK